MQKSIAVIRINPEARSLARLTLHAPRSPAIVLRNVKKMLRADVVQSREIMALEPVPLMVAAGMDVDRTMPGWKFGGMEETAGIAILFGRGPGGGMVDVPVTVNWVFQRITWLECVFGSEEFADDCCESVPK